MQAFLSCFGFVLLLTTYFTLPETSHPGARGVDKLIEAEGRSKWVWLNPFKSLKLLNMNDAIKTGVEALAVASSSCVHTDLVRHPGFKTNSRHALVDSRTIAAGSTN